MPAQRLFETALYAPDVETAARFYERLFDLERIADFSPRGIALSVGSGVLLIFDPERTRVRDREVPSHGAVGEGHIAFLVEESALPGWRERLTAQGIEIETEVQWNEGGISIYFRDPAGNSVELAPPTLWGGGWREPMSGEELARRPNLEPCELIEGRLIPLSPTSHRHALLENRLARVLANWAESAGSGSVLCGEVGIYIRRAPDTVRAADVLFLSAERYGLVASSSYLDVAPELVVEVLSPDDRWSDVMAKITDYLGAGVDRVWVVDDKQRRVFAYRSLSDVRLFEDGEILEDPELLPGFGMALGALFQ